RCTRAPAIGADFEPGWPYRSEQPTATRESFHGLGRYPEAKSRNGTIKGADMIPLTVWDFDPSSKCPIRDPVRYLVGDDAACALQRLFARYRRRRTRRNQLLSHPLRHHRARPAENSPCI